MDLFSHQGEDCLAGSGPLAERLRPQQLSDFVGQSRVLGPGSSLRKQIEEKGEIPNLILWGPPGTGKTTFSRLLAKYLQGEFLEVSAIDTGTKVLKKIGEEARFRRIGSQQRTLLFVDEIHRLNRSQQDVLLPFTERGDVVLVGATTENPAYELNNALLSRCQLILFEPLGEDDLGRVSDRALSWLKLDRQSLFSREALASLIRGANGDARRLIGWIEQVSESYQVAMSSSGSGDHFPLDENSVWEICSRGSIHYDRAGEYHYDCISAFIKSIRGSDPDAGLYYLARMLAGGEDPIFIARRLVILASEDVGNADPRGLSLAVAGLQAVEAVGLPEGAINLAQVVTYLACAPKSNSSYLGLRKAQAFVRDTGSLPVPSALRSGQNSVGKKLGFGQTYRYSHEGPTGWLEQDFLPEQAKGRKFFEPSLRGFEKTMQQYLDWMKGHKNN